MHGEEGAAKQASLCDLVEPARQLRRELGGTRHEELSEILRLAMPVFPQQVRDIVLGQKSLLAAAPRRTAGARVGQRKREEGVIRSPERGVRNDR